VEAFDEYNQLQDILITTPIQDGNDIWSWQFNNGINSSRSFYKEQFVLMHDHLLSKMIWKSKCMSKHKFFAWLILHDRINTKDMLIQRQWKVTDNNDCVLCHHVLEDWKHLFFTCLFQDMDLSSDLMEELFHRGESGVCKGSLFY
jgi:hypothetical protein